MTARREREAGWAARCRPLAPAIRSLILISVLACAAMLWSGYAAQAHSETPRAFETGEQPTKIGLSATSATLEISQQDRRSSDCPDLACCCTILCHVAVATVQAWRPGSFFRIARPGAVPTPRVGWMLTDDLLRPPQA